MGSKQSKEKQALLFYREMVKIRQFELKAADLFMQAALSGNIHTCVGEEAAIVGACQALEAKDFIAATHRGHGQCLSKGADPNRMMAELYGKETGYCSGKGGSMHIADVGLGILGANGIVGAGIPIATGSALTSKIKGTDEVTMVFFGDAASNQGVFHESINMAAAWNLPCIFFCVNNKYGVSVCIDRVCNNEDIADRAKGYNIPGVVVDGNDVFAVNKAVKEAAERARKGEGPTLIEAKTYRHRGHYEGDAQGYKPKEEVEAWMKKDPIEKLRKHILESGIAKEDKIAEIDKEVNDMIEAAVKFAEDSPWPNPDDVIDDVYSVENGRSVAR